MSEVWKKYKWEDGFFAFFLIVAFFVFFYHLGMMPLLDDEPTRALVSLEMVLSGNYVVPTNHGLLYQNKPPLFNWFIASLMHIFPYFNELTLRLPSMLAILLTSLATYLFFRKELNAKTALIVALAYLTCGRILFYDSMLGYIDPFFTLVLLLDTMLLYLFTKQKATWWMFAGSYLLCLIAYMLKGLPAILFHSLTLLVALFIAGKLKLLISWQHFLGIFLLFFCLSAYYFLYSQQQEVVGLFATLWDQSQKRTLSEFSWQECVFHLLSFPFQFVLHFLPWTLVSFVLFSKAAIKHIKSHPFLLFCSGVFLANIWVYWISPETKPRYLFVFLPFYFGVTVELFFKLATLQTIRVVYGLSMLLALSCAIAVLIPLFVPLLWKMDLSLTVSLVSMITIVLIADLMYKKPFMNLTLFALVLLSVRLVFNHFILPARKQEAPESEYKKIGIQIGIRSKKVPIHLLENTLIDDNLTYYISSTNRKILRYTTDSTHKSGYYICSEEGLKKERLLSEMEFYTDFQHAKLFLARKQ